MLKFLRQLIAQHVLLKVSSFNAAGVGVRLVCGLVTSKLIAFYLGSPGMAVLGDLRNFISSLQSIGQLGISNGVIKYSAEFKTDKTRLQKLISTVLKVGFLASVFLSVLLFFTASVINTQVFNAETNYTTIIKIFAIVLPFFTLNALMLNIINGIGNYKKVILINSVTNMVGVALTAILIVNYQLSGAMLAVVLSAGIGLFITLSTVFKKRSLFRELLQEQIDASMLKRLASYGGMTLFSAIVSPWVYIAIRQEIIAVDGLENAGYWDAMLRLSDYYLMFATTLLTLYILPKLSAATSKREFRAEVFRFYRTFLPLFGAGLIVLFFIKNWIIRLVYSPSFLEMQPIFIWQLAGDFFRVASLVIAYQMLAKNKFWLFIGTQVLSLSIIYFSSVFFIQDYGFVGAAMGHLLSYVLYLLVLLLIFRNALFGKFC